MKPGPLPRLGDFVFAGILMACLLLGQRMLNMDADIGRHLTLGRYMLATGRIPTLDMLSFTHTGEPRPPYEWASQVAFAVAERLIRIDGVVFLTACVIAAAFLIVYLDARERGGGALVSLALTIWAALASSLHWLTRPHVFTFLFLALWLWLLDRLRRGDRRAAIGLPVVVLLWANFHGGFIFGFMAWSAYALGWIVEAYQGRSPSGSAQKLLLVGVASLIASLLTPGLGGNWLAVLRNSSPYLISASLETAPLSIAIPGTWPFVGLALLSLLLGIRHRDRIIPAHAFLLLLTGLMALATMRSIPLFCLAAVPILAAWERGDPEKRTAFRRLEARISAIDSRSRGYVWALGATLGAALVLTGKGVAVGRGFYGFDQRRFPVAAAAWAAEQGLGGKTFNDINWGGYLLYRRWPDQPVFIDSQSDFYGEHFLREYSAMYTAAGEWRAALDRHRVSEAILPPNAPLAIELMADPAWTVVFQDSTAVVLVRRGT